MSSMEMKRKRMVHLLESLLPKEGVFPCELEKVKLFRTDNSFPREPKAYDPRIIIMAQGEKHIFLGNDSFVYGPAHYLVVSVPMPIECEAIAKPGEPILGFSVNVDSTAVGEILLEIDDPHPEAETLPQGIYSAVLKSDLADSAVRLLEALSSRKDAKVLGPMIVREIIYRVLCDEQGGALQALAHRSRRFFQIARVLNKIHESYDRDLDLKALAFEAGMSVSAFHSSFKAVTNTSPLQYIKSVRLHKARNLMIQEGQNAYNAAFSVGYESPSQFNREYKRFFGMPPGKDTVSSEGRVQLAGI